MPDRPEFQLSGVVLDAPNPRELAAFYRELLDWVIVDEDDTWVRMAPTPTARPSLACQLEENYVPPRWPGEQGAPQMQLHLDIQVAVLEEAVAFAESHGARQAAYQPQQGVRVMVDPVGHVFCLFLPGS